MTDKEWEALQKRKRLESEIRLGIYGMIIQDTLEKTEEFDNMEIRDRVQIAGIMTKFNDLNNKFLS